MRSVSRPHCADGEHVRALRMRSISGLRPLQLSERALRVLCVRAMLRKRVEAAQGIRARQSVAAQVVNVITTRQQRRVDSRCRIIHVCYGGCCCTSCDKQRLRRDNKSSAVAQRSEGEPRRGDCGTELTADVPLWRFAGARRPLHWQLWALRAFSRCVLQLRRELPFRRVHCLLRQAMRRRAIDAQPQR